MTAPVGSRPVTAIVAAEHLRAWQAGQVQPPVAYLTGAGETDRHDVIDAHLRRLGGSRRDGTPRWVRVAADGSVSVADADPYADSAEMLLGALLHRGEDLPEDRYLLAVDDLDSLRRDQQKRINKLITAPDELERLNLRLLVAVDADADDLLGHRYLHITLRTTFRRHRLLDDIGQWARDPLAADVMVVTGAPGTGKSILLQQAGQHLETVAGVQVGYAVSRAQTEDAQVLTVDRLVNGIAQVLAAEGIAYGTAHGAPARFSARADNSGSGSATAVRARDIHLHGAVASIAGLSLELDRRTANPDRPTIVVIVDAVDELDGLAHGGADHLRELLASRGRFADWGLKLLLSSQSPAVHVPATVVDLDALGAPDVRDYAVGRLTPRLGANAPAAADRLTDGAQGVFLIADDVLTQFADGTASLDSLLDALTEPVARVTGDKSPSRAAQHIMTALEAVSRRGDPDWTDVLRFLTLSSLTPDGLHEHEMARLWDAPDLDVSARPVRWRWDSDLLRVVDASPVRRFLLAVDQAGSGARYGASHSAVREGVLAFRSRAPGLTVADERERFLRWLTPLAGSGPGWDAAARPGVLAVAPAMLASLIAGASPAGPALPRYLSWARALVEEWRWLEECIGGADGDVPLGVGRAVLELDHLGRCVAQACPDGFLLWQDVTEPVYGDLPQPADPEPSRPAASAGKRAPSAAKVATLRHPTIAAVLSGSYRFRDRAAADRQLAVLARSFRLSRLHDWRADPSQLVVYIRGYALTPARVAAGFRGYFARVTVERHDEHTWTLRDRPYEGEVTPAATPDAPPRAAHAQPNWGHPILRRVRRNTDDDTAKRPYRTWTDAAEELSRLHEEYPRTTIPVPGMLYMEVYEKWRRKRGQNPARKIVLHIVPNSAGEFLIRWRYNPAGGEEE